MSSSRFVKYNEDLFKIPSGTKKRKTGGDKPPIRIKPQTNKTIKWRILDELRKNQQQQLNTLCDMPPIPSSDSKFETDFKNSVDYMQSFVDNHKKETITTHKLNSTIKEKKVYQVPTYGCLKNGNLPTYRNIHGVTLKHKSPFADVTGPSATSPFAIGPSVTSPFADVTGPSVTSPLAIGPSATSQFADVTGPSVTSPFADVTGPLATSPFADVTGPSVTSPSAIGPSVTSPSAIGPSVTSPFADMTTLPLRPSISERIKSPSEILLKEKTKQKSKVIPVDKHKRKFLRRTYHVGKDKYKPKVGVLLPNKTIRKRVTTSSYLLKQTPIEDIRKFLLKKGFIKVGSSAPNDVLRKMYESIQMIDGEINNHNSENLLHNFFNHK
jgi:hypothetical protein